MNKIGIKIISFSFIILLSFSSIIYASENRYKASIAQMPVISESPEKGVLVFLVKSWAEATGNEIDIKVYPFKRALDNAISGEADFEFPFIRNPYIDENKLSFDYSTSIIYDVNFVLYTSKNKTIDKNNLSNYKIGTDAAHVDYFDFKVLPEYDVESALKKIDLGRIDGFIHADVVVDPVLKNLGLKSIKRELFKVYHVHAILPKGEKGKDTDLMITEALKRVKKSGRFSELMDPVYKEYNNWQP
jgi:polar amino acid transport system substrate-binding protein